MVPLYAKVGIGVLVIKNGKCLMSERKNSHGKGVYQFPGGHLEHMESFEACARREVREEAGIEIANVRFAYVANVKTFAPKHYVHVGVTADWLSGEPQQLEPEKAGPWGWYELNALAQPTWNFCTMHIQAQNGGAVYFDNVV